MGRVDGEASTRLSMELTCFKGNSEDESVLKLSDTVVRQGTSNTQ